MCRRILACQGKFSARAEKVLSVILKSPMKRILRRCGALLIFVRLVSAQATTDPVPEANPARPTVSTPATLTPVGYLQFETGSLGATTSPEFNTRVSINQVTKLTVLPRLE